MGKAPIPLYKYMICPIEKHTKTIYFSFCLSPYKQFFLKSDCFFIYLYILFWVKESTILRASHPTSNVDLQGNTARWLGLLYPGDGVQNYCLLHRKIL